MSTLTNGKTTETRSTGSSASGHMAQTSSEKGLGWILFAGIMLMLAGGLNIIWGLAALGDSGFFVTNGGYILITSLSTWGWIAIGFGTLELLAAFSVWRGGSFGRWFGIAIACLAIIPALMSMPAYPFWALMLVTIEILVIYGLAAFGGEPELME